MVISSRTRRGDQPDDPPITSGRLPLPPPLWPSSKAHQREAGCRPTRPSGSSGCPSEREVCSSLLPRGRQKAVAVGQYLRRRRRAARSPQAPPFLVLSGGKTCGESPPPHTQLTIRLRVRRCGCSRTAACRAVAGTGQPRALWQRHVLPVPVLQLEQRPTGRRGKSETRGGGC